MALGYLGLVAYWFLNYLSGYALYRFVFRKSNTLELFIIPQIIGLFMLPFLFTISYFAVGFGASLYLAPVLAVLSSAISFQIPQKVSREKTVDKRLVLVLLAFLIPVSYSFTSSSIFLFFHNNVLVMFCRLLRNIFILLKFFFHNRSFAQVQFLAGGFYYINAGDKIIIQRVLLVLGAAFITAV